MAEKKSDADKAAKAAGADPSEDTHEKTDFVKLADESEKGANVVVKGRGKARLLPGGGAKAPARESDHRNILHPPDEQA